ncbi:CGNR zinc finger domain-containing protein [Microbacterium sp. ARD32]|uniref:CGNR zinc finger domain-containing protein n=1 Tax=Microbacterium sp. ARD32 TaxID=2962577 RepID=UPI0028825FF8|nr:CGNR zinc finger domain-containing protein [Microbacterium sp. ARD32]MDT0157614.1 CGNR zinc finger domain-containing protein [Microbacterium sp. ARD32]
MTTGRTQSFSQLGGHRMLDLVNTVHWRLSPDRRRDALADYGDILDWALQLGILNDAETESLRDAHLRDPRRAARVVDEVRALRDAVYAALYESADPGPVVDAYRAAISEGVLAPGARGWRWTFPLDLDLPLRRIALDAVDLLTDDRQTSLAQCQDAECGWVFLDTSPRHNRRWCDSADCGNRNRVREYYNRRRDGDRERATGV